jgi:hypothetical protein
MAFLVLAILAVLSALFVTVAVYWLFTRWL